MTFLFFCLYVLMGLLTILGVAATVWCVFLIVKGIKEDFFN